MCFINDEISKKHIIYEPICTFNESLATDGFHGVWLHFQRARVGCAFDAKYRQGSATSSPSISCFSQGERSAVQLPLDRAFALQK